MIQHAPLRLIVSGFLATFVMTMMMHPLFSAGLPSVEFATLIGTRFAGATVEPYSAWWFLGLLEHAFNGVILFPVLFSAVFSRLLPNNAIVSGLLWGGALWLASQVIFLPLFGYGFFANQIADPYFLAPLTLLIHAVYGLIFGAVLGGGKSVERAEESPHIIRREMRKAS